MKKARTVIWHDITGKETDEMPDAELEVLVFDGDLNDTVKASMDDSGGEAAWFDQVTGEPLPNPQWWCEVPFPG